MYLRYNVLFFFNSIFSEMYFSVNQTKKLKSFFSFFFFLSTINMKDLFKPEKITNVALTEFGRVCYTWPAYQEHALKVGKFEVLI